jgi:hypothetical protein
MGNLLEQLSVTSGRWAQQRAYKKEAQRNEELSKDAQIRLDQLKNNRQDVINPYDQTQAFTFTNPMENLAVATQAAEFQAEEADLALASTLDNMRASGAGAGGATALANAALRSKKQISASIQQQEAQNQKLMAQGEMNRQRFQATEEARVQKADAAGKAFVFNAEERRQFRDEDFEQDQMQYYRNLQDQYRAAKTAGVGSTVSQTMYTAGNVGIAGVNMELGQQATWV